MVQPSSSPATYANIMVQMDFERDSELRAALAAALADRFCGRLVGIAAHPIETPLYFESAVEGVPSIIDVERRRASETIAKTEAAFRRIAGTRNMIEWRHALTYPLEYILRQARAADLIVVGRPVHLGDAIGPMTVDGGDVVMDAGRPVLFVPPGTDQLSAKRVIVGWKDTREARRAVRDSLPLLKGAKEVFVVATDKNDQGVTDVVNYLSSHNVEACAVTRPESTKDIADELIRIASQEGADLIVCGAYGHSRTREWVFGGVTHDLLNYSPLCCLMSR